MVKTVAHTTMSFDGRTVGPNGEMDWVFEGAGPNPVIDEFVPTVGAILMGRRTYGYARSTPDTDGPETQRPYGGAWNGPIIVLTHEPPAIQVAGVRFFTGELGDAVAIASAAAGEGRCVAVFGSDIARQCMEAGLLDEVLVHVAPVMLGAGTRFFDHLDLPARLRLIDVSAAGETVNLRYEIVR
ncbi:MAG TPA: dihydrofolate reductase family protein [Micromonosporaceae bacterium]|jgi:dihydrofolate reductase